MRYEYKTVGAPEKGQRRRGLKSPSDRVAAAFEEIIEAEAVDGWEYLRTDLVPVTERANWFSRSRMVTRAVMVFRRPLEQARPAEFRESSRPTPVPRAEPTVMPGPRTAATTDSPSGQPAGARSEPQRSEPTIASAPDRQLAELIRGPSPAER